MEQFYEQIKNWILPAAFIVGGIIIGIIVEKIVMSRIKRVARKDKWDIYYVIIKSLKGIMVFLFVLAGIYVAILYLPMSEKLSIFLYKILKILAIILVTLFAARVTVELFNMYFRKTKSVFSSTSIMAILTKIMVFIIGALIVMQSLGISIAPLLTALGVGGLAVALALQDTLSNFFSGIHIIASGQVKPGDYIKLDSGEEGYVVDITWKNTSIRALANNLIIVPNSKLSSAILTNYYQPATEMSVLVNVGVSYSSDLEKVEKFTIEVSRQILKEIEGGVPEFELFIRYHTFADFSINYSVILRVKEFVNQYMIKREFVKKLHQQSGN